MKRKTLANGFLAMAALELCGCTVGPNYHAPPSNVPSTYVESAALPSTAPPSRDQDLSSWWRQFGDGTLNALIERALAHNLTLASANSRIREARFQQIEAGAAEYPSLSASGSALALSLIHISHRAAA